MSGTSLFYLSIYLAILCSPEFPTMKSFSTRNLKYMRRFAKEFLDIEFVQQVAAQLPLGHHMILSITLLIIKLELFI